MRLSARYLPFVLAPGLALCAADAALAQGRAVPRGADPGYRQNYPDGRHDGDPYGRNRGTWGGYRSIAFDYGFDDGYRQGFDDGKDGDGFDPIGSRRYRQGDHRYDRRYGPKEYYKREYRSGFRSGYERGFREGRYDTRYDRRRGNGWAWGW